MKTEKAIPKNINFRGFLGFFFIFLIWALLTYAEIVKPFFLPSPLSVLNSLIELFIESNLFGDILISLYRVVVGFVFAVIVAVPVGILVGTSKSAEAYISPLASYVRYIPTSAFVPLSIIWFGIGDIGKFFIIFSGVVPFLLILVADVVSNVKSEFIEAGHTLGASKKHIYTEIIIPYSLPGIWDAMRLMFGAAWSLIILAEIIAATSGLGHVILHSQRFLQTGNVIAAILIIGFLGMLVDYFFKVCYKKFFSWSERGA
ncbi:MAG: ABC transporter permease [Candidatus Diapherotrites archaeon]|nr:ABC transporter permease [Candidatus Diapherotrites archaeon]